jgi:hypothetical protein
MKNFLLTIRVFVLTLFVNIFVKVFNTTMLKQQQFFYKGSWLSYYSLTFDLSKADRVVIKRSTSKAALEAVETYHYNKFNALRVMDLKGNMFIDHTIDNDNLLFCPSNLTSKVYTLYLSNGNRRCNGSTFTPRIISW